MGKTEFPEIGPGEQALYRARYGLGEIARYVLVVSVVALLLGLAWLVGIAMLFRPDGGVMMLFGSGYWIAILVSANLFGAVSSAMFMWQSAVIVTDRRILYRTTS